MRLELFNRSKYRDGSAPGDDVPLVVPGVAYGVFDGATDPLGTVVDGIAAGRLAALTVASEMTAIALDRSWRMRPGPDIVERLSLVLKVKTDPLDLDVPPSTTLAVALDCGATWRFLILGDTGIRLNGSEVHHHEKILDDVSTAARVAVFNDLSRISSDLDKVEQRTRRAIFLGLEIAIAERVLTQDRALEIIDNAVTATALHEDRNSVAAFLMGGIQTQYKLGNAASIPLGFDTMNGTLPQRGELRDFECAKADITRIEIFSDGYPTLPSGTDAAAWEDAFQTAEESDFHKIGDLATVKGSTSTEYFDDRSVVILG